MGNSIINTMRTFNNNLTKAGTFAAKETFYLSYEVEISNITFNIDYNDTNQMYDIYSCNITFNYGDSNGTDWYRDNNIVLDNVPEYKLDDINYLYGVFCGYFNAKELITK